MTHFSRWVRKFREVLLLVTDAAPYMVLAGQILQTIFGRSVAHGIHRLCEKVRELFPEVNKLVSWALKIFHKCPARISIYNEIMQCPLPPDVVVSRWGTWVRAALFFANKFEKNFPKSFHSYLVIPFTLRHWRRYSNERWGLAADLAFSNQIHNFPLLLKILWFFSVPNNANFCILIAKTQH